MSATMQVDFCNPFDCTDLGPDRDVHARPERDPAYLIGKVLLATVDARDRLKDRSWGVAGPLIRRLRAGFLDVLERCVATWPASTTVLARVDDTHVWAAYPGDAENDGGFDFVWSIDQVEPVLVQPYRGTEVVRHHQFRLHADALSSPGLAATITAARYVNATAVWPVDTALAVPRALPRSIRGDGPDRALRFAEGLMILSRYDGAMPVDCDGTIVVIGATEVGLNDRYRLGKLGWRRQQPDGNYQWERWILGAMPSPWGDDED